jgi:Ca2+-transporting ATPase
MSVTKPSPPQQPDPGRKPGRRQSQQAFTAEIIHAAVAGRLRLRHLGLVARADLARAMEAGMRGLPGVVSARASPLTGSVLLEYEAPMRVRRLVRAVEKIVAGRPLRRAPNPRRAASPRAAHALSAAAAPVSAPCSQDQTWHALSAEQAADRLGTQRSAGLASDEIAHRQTIYGRNALQRAEPRGIPAIFGEQLTSLPIAMLGVSAALSLATGGAADAAMIAAVVMLNASIATGTERQAERTILGLSDYAPQPVWVVRDGTRQSVDPGELVPGDLLLLERGTLVPADARLIVSDDLTVNEAPLTGEALPVHKDAELLLPSKTGLPDRRNMVFRGTAVTGGSGSALITAIGQATQIGQVQALLGSLRPPETPIQRQLGDVGRELVIVNSLICGAVFGLGMMRGQGLVPTLRSAISLAVAAIPEGLPAVATTTLALGIQDMRRRHVLVRKIDAVETLGAVEVIGLDKTGTLTENRMATIALHADDTMLVLDGGRLTRDGEDAAAGIRGIVRRLLEVASLCNDAVVQAAPEGFTVEGTPTESALVEAALALGVDVPQSRLAARVLATVGRGEGRKRMSTLHETADGSHLLCVKGDPIEVLTRCTAHRTADGIKPLDEATRAAVQKANERMAAQALRVLGVAVDEAGGDPRNEREMVWLGLAGLANPIRPSVLPALKQLHGAGIRTVMITGDQSATAFAIARSLELNNDDELKVLEAGQIAGLQPDVLAALAAQPQVFARVSPVDKLNIVKALQAGGRIVAMTGDGINDGPALRAANVGIAMGGAGTDVAREVADIVLARDDLDGIIEAIRLGRATYANIRKVLRYLVSTNASETLTMLGAALAGSAEPLTPMQLLWLNLASDPLPALALGLEPPESDVLDHPPYDPRAPILTVRDFRRILLEGTVMGTASLAGFFASGAGPRAGTITFHALTMMQLMHAVTSRSETRGILAELGRAGNPTLYGTIAASAVLQVAVQAFPTTRRLLRLTPLGAGDLLRVGAVVLGSTLLNNVLDTVLLDWEGPPRPPRL